MTDLRDGDATLLRRMRVRQDEANAERERAGQWVGRTAPIAFSVNGAAALACSTSGRARAALKRLTDAGYLDRIATPGCIVIWQLSREGQRFA